MKAHIWVSVCVSCYRAFISRTEPPRSSDGVVKLPKHRRNTRVNYPECPTEDGFLQHFVVEIEPQIEKVEEFPVEVPRP